MLVTKYDERQCFGNTFIHNVLHFSRKINNCNRKLNCAIREDDVYFEKIYFFQKKTSHFLENSIAQFYDNFSKQKYLEIIDFFEKKNRIKIKENKNFI